ncbi:Flp family type IVb pilin [Jannaschia ovalis]|uniref:DUF642 domain-containing protein n=1 Tax=Jannaschia ovalis TaxID=3038773 RepID=A0ABY8LC34_9RHOB|nr:hypothetical protein [Jannaschia sp. GRR-S6-38]WGH78882.1 hypothetical protein P8627_01070 [Jannaschia sp. GRR-S6-38]
MPSPQASVPLLHRFARSEDGAITVEWVLLTALGAAIAIASTDLVNGGLRVFASTVSEAVTGESDAEFLSVDISNGSFETVLGLPTAEWGFAATEIDGWTSTNGEKFEIKNSGHNGIEAFDGNQFLDMGESPGNLAITQNFENAVAGETYVIGFAASDYTGGTNSVEVYWAGELVGTATPGGAEWQTYDFVVTAGDGPTANTVEIREVGQPDSVGTYIDSIGLYRTN